MTRKPCWPSARLDAVNVPESQATGASASTRHLKVEGSSDENAKVGVGSPVLDPLAGPDVIATVGGPVSTVKLRRTRPPVLPAASAPLTENVCGPSRKASVSLDRHGDVQGTRAESSILHSNSAGSLAENSKVGLVSAVIVPSAGPESIRVIGASLSGKAIRVAGIG